MLRFEVLLLQLNKQYNYNKKSDSNESDFFNSWQYSIKYLYTLYM